ncbi:MAG: Hcp family type VI secretion system effector [Candidatus Hodarchaeales archaeon]
MNQESKNKYLFSGVIATLLIFSTLLIGFSSVNTTSTIAELTGIEGLDAAFIKFSNVAPGDGGSQDENHQDYFDVLNLNLGVFNPSPGFLGGRRATTSAIFEDFEIVTEATGYLEKAIFESITKGTAFDEVIIDLTATYGGARASYYEITLRNARATYYYLGASGNDEAGPPTIITRLSYERIKFVFTVYDQEGSSKGNVEWGWDLEANEEWH